MVRRQPSQRRQPKAESGPAGPPLWDPKFHLQLTGGALAGMPFTVGDWKFPDSPPEVVWLAEVDRQVVGHAQEYLDAVAGLVRDGLPGWTPYERARQRWTGARWVDLEPGEWLTSLGDVRLAPPVDGVYSYAWAARMDPNLREPRHLKAVS